MSLEEFKFIYWMEYAHRMWGRALGLVFAVPAVYFGVRGYMNSALAKSLGLFFLMGATQGLVGWWMVKSGLQVWFSPSKGYTQVFFQRLQLPLPLQNQHMPVFLAHAILLYLLYDCLQGQLLQDPRQLIAVWLGLQSALKYCTGAVHLGASDVFI